MPAVSQHIRQRGENALRWLDELPGSDTPRMRQQLGAVIQDLAAMRDGLIILRREGKLDGNWLARTNAVVSSLFGTEFPIDGLNRSRIEETRTALRQLLSDMNRPTASRRR
jgi:hypothetical protein